MNDRKAVSQEPADAERHRAMRIFSVVASAGALASEAAAHGDAPAATTPRRALTGRDAANGKSVQVVRGHPQAIPIDANPGLTFRRL